MYTHPYLRQAALKHKALGNERRLKIIELLRENEYTGASLMKELGITAPAVSKHLRCLLLVGIIDGRRKGGEVYFRIVERV
jgi:ArsR family transcriptional regulator